MPSEKYVIISDEGDFLMKGAAIDSKDINWAGNRNLAATFDYDYAQQMKARFNKYRSDVNVVSRDNTTQCGRKKNAE